MHCGTGGWQPPAEGAADVTVTAGLQLEVVGSGGPGDAVSGVNSLLFFYKYFTRLLVFPIILYAAVTTVGSASPSRLAFLGMLGQS